MKKWLPILVLGLTQFVMVLDGTVMNVSITEVVGDLGTTTSNMQLAIATFTLTMAALMLAGAGLSTRLGLRRTFVIGNVIYAIGSLTTAFAPRFAALFVGWSLVEGLGAALVVPAIAALAAVNYSGRERAMAYAVLGGIAGAASAAGPLIGGWMTTYLSWRWVFGFETLIILLLVLPLHRRIVDQRPTATQGRFDWPGVLLSALSMGLIVLALVSASTWGLIQPINPPFTVWGFSPTLPMVVLGALVAWGFISWQEHLQTHGGSPLVGLDLLRIAAAQPSTAPFSALATEALVGAEWDALDHYQGERKHAETNAMLALRVLANGFVAPGGPQALNDMALEALATLQQPPWAMLNKNARIALATIALKYVPVLTQLFCARGATRRSRSAQSSPPRKRASARRRSRRGSWQCATPARTPSCRGSPLRPAGGTARGSGA